MGAKRSSHERRRKDQALQDQGLCIDCKQPTNNALVRCNDCNASRLAAQRAAYVRRRQAGLCVLCGSAASDGKSRCAECRADDLQRVQELIRVGICISCCSAPAVDGTQKCRPCLDKEVERLKRLYAKRRAKGVCWGCGCKLPDSKHRNCKRCRKKNAERARIRYHVARLNAKRG